MAKSNRPFYLIILADIDDVNGMAAITTLPYGYHVGPMYNSYLLSCMPHYQLNSEHSLDIK